MQVLLENRPGYNPGMKTRRFCQFSLKSLFVLVTLVALPCGYVAWQHSIVEKRQAMLAQINELGGNWKESDGNCHVFCGNARTVFLYGQFISHSGTFVDVSSVRRLIGDRTVRVILVPNGTPIESISRIHEVFPEANIFHTVDPKVLSVLIRMSLA